jgi:hypothetical protein
VNAEVDAEVDAEVNAEKISPKAAIAGLKIIGSLIKPT